MNEVQMSHNESSAANIDLMAERLLDARASGIGIHATDILTPTDIASAMHIQALVQEGSKQAVTGWKVAIGPKQIPVSAPLVQILRSPAEINLFPNCLIEVEVAFILNSNLPKKEVPYDRSEILDAISHVFLGLEIIGGRFNEPKGVPFLSFLSDHLGNRAFVVGDNLPRLVIDELADFMCEVSFNGSILHTSKAAHPTRDPIAPLLAYANQPNDYLGGLKAGQIVATGSICGVIPIENGGVVRAALGNLGCVSIAFEGPNELIGFLLR
jgi:2-keto-4-pentenoate hydratase